MKAPIACLLIAVPALLAQDAPRPPEQQELIQALTDANNSAIDVIRVLEAYLKKYPQTPQRKEIERALTKAAIDSKDHRRIVLYGEPVLALTPQDIPVLDRVAESLVALGGAENAEKALQYAVSFEQMITSMGPPEGLDAARRQDERDRALARTFLYQSRAKTILGARDDAAAFAAKAFSAYPSEEAAREWSEALARLGKNEEAVARLADAFAIVDARASDADRAADRRQLGEIYRKIHGSETGLGDVILTAYDRTGALIEERRARLRKLDPNFGFTEPMQFTLSALDGKKLSLASLKGSVVIMDFWATWCTPCRAQHPMYETVKERFKNRSDVVFLAVDTDEDRQLVEPFLEQQKWSRSVYFDEGLQRLLQVSQIPTTLMFDKKGRLWSRMNGFVPDRFVDLLTERINDALAESQ